MARSKQTARPPGESRPLQKNLHGPRIARKSAPVTTGVKSMRNDSDFDSSSLEEILHQPDSSIQSQDVPDPAPQVHHRRRERRPRTTRLVRETSRYRGHISREFHEVIKNHLSQANLHPSQMEIRFNRHTMTMSIRMMP